MTTCSFARRAAGFALVLAVTAAAPLRLRDGSGLSRLNLLTPVAVVALLRHAAREGSLQQPFCLSLPVAGVDGTLAERMAGTSAAGVVHAKTGALTGVCALSGYVDGKEERNLTFTSLVNDYACGGSLVRRVVDEACVALADYAAAR